MIPRDVPHGEVRWTHPGKTPASAGTARHVVLTSRLDAIDARLERVPDVRRTDFLATLPTATAAMLAVILPMVGVTVAGVLVVFQVTLWLPVAYKVARKL